jgi:uncharacterized membrane protein YfcA
VAAVITVAVAAFAGALIQRLSGIGFALVAAPLLIVSTNVYDGVRLTNLLMVLVGVSIVATSPARPDVKQAKLLVPAGLLGVLPGVLVVRTLRSGPLQVTVGALVGGSLLAVTLLRQRRVRPSAGLTLGAGVASGFTNAAAGVGGPALTIYAVATGWPQEAFAVTSQLSFAAQSAMSLAVGGLPHVSPPLLVLVLCAVAAGLAVGHVCSRYVPTRYAARAALVLAALGTLGTIIKGLLS